MSVNRDKKTLTVFTPTYNRSTLLIRVYESLSKQTSKDFVWQVIDDGSTDDTDGIMQTLLESAEFPIEYIRKENGGKISAINKSLDHAWTDAWVCLDSDDWLLPHAVEEMIFQFEIIRNMPKICGLIGVRFNTDLLPMAGKYMPQVVEFATQNYVRYTLDVPPEYVQVYKTEILKQYRFPLIPKEKYIPLSYVTDQIDCKYKLKLIHDPWMVCEYLADGITKNHRKIVIANPIGYTLFQKQRIELAESFLFRVKAGIAYNTGCRLSKNRNWLKDAPFKPLVLLLRPLSLIDYLIRYRKHVAHK